MPQRVSQVVTHRVPRRRADGGPVGAHLHVAMTLDVTRVRPVEQSPLPPEESALPSDVAAEAACGLILDLSPVAVPSATTGAQPAKATSAFRLDAQETIDGVSDQGVVWTLSAVEGASQEPGKLLVIDPTPFRIAAVEGLRPESSDTAQQIAQCALESGVPVWRFRDSAQEVRLLLPTQTLGEAMEKNGPGRKPADIEPDQPAAMRFGSLTRIDVDPTLRDSGSREPGWNLRRLFNRVADADPGVVVRDLRVELAYGLLVQHRPVQRTRLAELAGIIGAPPSIDQRGGAPSLPKGVKALLLLEASRIAVDKLWRDHPSEDFETSDGLRFTLRRRDEKGGGPETPFRFPAPSGYPGAGGADPSFLKSFADPNDENANKDAFPGGIPWAFDSANVLRECYADPVSTTGCTGRPLPARRPRNAACAITDCRPRSRTTPPPFMSNANGARRRRPRPAIPHLAPASPSAAPPSSAPAPAPRWPLPGPLSRGWWRGGRTGTAHRPSRRRTRPPGADLRSG